MVNTITRRDRGSTPTFRSKSVILKASASPSPKLAIASASKENTKVAKDSIIGLTGCPNCPFG